MDRTNLIFGLALLSLAAIVAVSQTDDSEEPVASRRPASIPPADRRRALDRGDSHPPLTTSLRTPLGTLAAPDFSVPILERLAVEPISASHPALEAQAQRVQNGALNRLEELARELDLTERQQLDIFPLLARSHPDYSTHLHLVGVPVSAEFDPLGKVAAERRIFKLLDEDQKLELEFMAAAADVWWTDVIARLEKDLLESTREPVPTGPAPEHDPAPPEEEPPPAPPAIVPSNPRGNGQNNLNDLLRPRGS